MWPQSAPHPLSLAPPLSFAISTPCTSIQNPASSQSQPGQRESSELKSAGHGPLPISSWPALQQQEPLKVPPSILRGNALTQTQAGKAHAPQRLPHPSPLVSAFFHLFAQGSQQRLNSLILD